MAKPKISVIVPVYNAQDYLNRCINSILSQTESNFELILINDCSTDNSAKMCDEYAKADKRVNVIHLKENSGPSIARNVAIDRAVGEFIAFIDSDDWVDLNYFEAMLSTAQKTNSDIVSCTALWTRHNSPELAKVEPLNNPDIILNREQALVRLFTDNGILHVPWGKIYKKQLFGKDVRYPEKILLEDLLTTYKLIDRAKIITITSSTTYYYFQSSRSLTRGGFPPSTLEALPLVDNIKGYLGNPTGELAEAIEYCKYATTQYAINSMIDDGGFEVQCRQLMKSVTQNKKSYFSNRFLTMKKKVLLLTMHSYSIYSLQRNLLNK